MRTVSIHGLLHPMRTAAHHARPARRRMPRQAQTPPPCQPHFNRNLSTLRLPELRQLFKEVFGEPTKSKNSQWLCRKLSEAPTASQRCGRRVAAAEVGGASAPKRSARTAPAMPVEQLQFYAQWAAHLAETTAPVAAATQAAGAQLGRAQGLVAGTLEPAVQQQLCPPPLPRSWSQLPPQLEQAGLFVTPSQPPSTPQSQLPQTGPPLVPLARAVSAPAAAMASQHVGADDGGSWSSGGCGPPAALYAAEALGAATAFVYGSQMAGTFNHDCGTIPLPSLQLLMQADAWAAVDASPLTPQESSASIGTSCSTATGQPETDAGPAASATAAAARTHAVCDGMGALWTDAGLGVVARFDEIMGSNSDYACPLGSLLEDV